MQWAMYNTECGLSPEILIQSRINRSIIMDYQQSIKNLNHLKNFVRAWTECRIFFFFYSDSEYKIEIYNTKRTNKQKKRIDRKRRSKFPYSFISNDESGEETLYYRDQNIAVEYDLFLQKTTDFICNDPVDKKRVQQQFLLLIELLKNK